jgi:hypothetical protein
MSRMIRLTVTPITTLTIPPKIELRFLQAGGFLEFASKSSRDLPALSSSSMGENMIDWGGRPYRKSGGGMEERCLSNFGRCKGAA